MATEATDASGRRLSSVPRMLLRAWSLSLIGVVLLPFMFLYLVSLLLTPVVIIAWALPVRRLPKSPHGGGLAPLALVLAPMLLIGPALGVAEATGRAMLADQRARIFESARMSAQMQENARLAREATATAQQRVLVSVVLGLVAAGLEVWGVRRRTGEPVPNKEFVFLLFAVFGLAVYLLVRLLSAALALSA